MTPKPVAPDLPRFTLDDPTPTQVQCLQSLQRMLLTHPVACQAAYTALIREGRRFAATPEGQAWQSRLVHSSLLRRVRLAFDLTTLGLLDEQGAGPLPSSYLDALFMIAAGGDTDEVVNRLFWGRTGEKAHEPSRD